MALSYKFGFLALTGVFIIIGAIPFGMSQVGQTEPSMEIDMLSGQTQSPFRIQDHNDLNVFTVKPNGGLDPIPTEIRQFTPTGDYLAELYPFFIADNPNLVITETAESGAGVYQYTYTITADDLDTSVDSEGIFKKRDGLFSFAVVAQLENIGVGQITSNWSIWLNDVELEQSNDATVPVSNYVQARWMESGNFYDFGIFPTLEVGDVIGFKIWTDTSGDLRLNKIGIQSMPVLQVSEKTISIIWDDPHDEVGSNQKITPTTPTEFGSTSITERLINVYDGCWSCTFENVGYAGADLHSGGNVWNGLSVDVFTSTAGDGLDIFTPNDMAWNSTGNWIVTQWK